MEFEQSERRWGSGPPWINQMPCGELEKDAHSPWLLPVLLPTTHRKGRRLGEGREGSVSVSTCSLEAREGVVGGRPAYHLWLRSFAGIRKWEHPGPTWKEWEKPSLPKVGSRGGRVGPGGPSVASNAKTRRETLRTSLVVQWLRLQTPNTGALGLIPGQGIWSHMPPLSLRAAAKASACHS